MWGREGGEAFHNTVSYLPTHEPQETFCLSQEKNGNDLNSPHCNIRKGENIPSILFCFSHSVHTRKSKQTWKKKVKQLNEALINAKQKKNHFDYRKRRKKKKKKKHQLCDNTLTIERE